MNEPILDIDAECYSDVPIKCGPHRYTESPVFDLLCVAWKYWDGAEAWSGIWYPGSPLPEPAINHIGRGGTVVAHNAPFERAVFATRAAQEYGWRLLLDGQLLCTQALCLQHNLPPALEEAAAALKLKIQKDMVGNALMMKFCKPDRKGARPIPTQDELCRIGAYCMTDVAAEGEIRGALFPMPVVEKRFWNLDQKINQRGIRVDRRAVHHGIRIMQAEMARLDADMSRVTGGAVPRTTCGQALAQFCGMDSVAVGVLEAVLDEPDNYHLTEVQAQALALRMEARNQSVKKLLAMEAMVCEDDRLHDLYQYHGAGATGREAGRGVQPQNLPSPKVLKKPAALEAFLGAIGDLDAEDVRWVFGPPIRVLADALRGFLIPAPGHQFVQLDFSAIEGMMLAWLSGEEWVLKIYRTHGKMYEATASRIYGVPIEEITKEDPRRQIGKVAELAMGYQGGGNAFHSMAKNYGVVVTDAQAESIRDAWRASRPATVLYWKVLENASMEAMLHPGRRIDVGGKYATVSYLYTRTPGGQPVLFNRLPSGRNIAYPFPAIEEVKTPWGELRDQVTYRARVPGRKKQFWRKNLYGGLLTENVTQAAARDVLRDAMLRFDEAGWKIVHDCHDELVNEEPIGGRTFADAKPLAEVVPPWAVGLPLRVTGREMSRYQKG